LSTSFLLAVGKARLFDLAFRIPVGGLQRNAVLSRKQCAFDYYPNRYYDIIDELYHIKFKLLLMPYNISTKE
jgi:hypothetical protein